MTALIFGAAAGPGRRKKACSGTPPQSWKAGKGGDDNPFPRQVGVGFLQCPFLLKTEGFNGDRGKKIVFQNGPGHHPPVFLAQGGGFEANIGDVEVLQRGRTVAESPPGTPRPGAVRRPESPPSAAAAGNRPPLPESGWREARWWSRRQGAGSPATGAAGFSETGTFSWVSFWRLLQLSDHEIN